jgi:hypothetical protein
MADEPKKNETFLLRAIASTAVNMLEAGVYSGGGSGFHTWRCHPRWADALAQSLVDAGYTIDTEARDNGTDIGFGRWERQSYQERRSVIAKALWNAYDDECSDEDWVDVEPEIVREYEDMAEKLMHLAGAK